MLGRIDPAGGFTEAIMLFKVERIFIQFQGAIDTS
jgi:hypothetical protein